MKKWLIAVLFASLLALAACGGGGDGGTTDDQTDTGTDTEQPAQDDATDDDATDGDATVDTAAAEEVYKKSCASCHAADLSGGVGPDLTAVGSKLSADEIETIINDGVGTMPPGLVSADDSKLLADWLAEKK